MTDPSSRELTICRKCGTRALPGQEFTTAGPGAPVLCPGCRSRAARHDGLSMLAGIAAVLVCGYLLVQFGKGDTVKGGWVVLNLGLGWLMGTLLTIPHELAHAFVAGLFRHRVVQVVIGYGRPLFRLNPGFPVELRLIPLGGFCSHQPIDGKWRRQSDFWIAAAGPLSHVVLGLGAWLLAGRPALSSFDPTRGLSLLWIFIGWNVLDFLWNAVPGMATINGAHRVPNDGMCMLRAVLHRDGPQPDSTPVKAPVPPAPGPAPLLPRVCLWTGAVAGVIGAVQQIMSGVEGEPLGRTASLLACAWILVTFICMRAAFYLEERASAPPPSRRIAAGESVHSGFDEMLFRELAAVVPENEEAFRAAMGGLSKLLADRAWPAVVEHCSKAIDEAGPHPRLLLLRAEALYETGRLDESRRDCEALSETPHIGPATAAIATLWTATVELLQGNSAEAVRQIDDFSAFEQSTAVRLYVLDQAAREVFVRPCPSLLPDALRWNGETLEVLPGNASFRAVQGVLLALDAGTAEAAAAQLKEVQKLAEHRDDLGLTHYGLAVIARRSRDEATARRHFARARLLLDADWVKRDEAAAGTGSPQG